MKNIYSLILWLLFPLLLQAQYKINTVFGDGNTAITNQSIGGSTSMAKDSQGNFYLATAGSHVILKISPAQLKTVFAGNGTAGFSGDNGPATAARLHAPSSVTVQGNDLYIADQGNRRIRKIDLTTHIITTVAGDGTEEITGNGLGGCNGVAVDQLLNIYVSTGSKNTVKKITPTGVHSTFAGTGLAGYEPGQTIATATPLNAPAALFLKDNNLYIADMGNRRIRKVSLATNLLSTVAGDGTTAITANGLGGCNGVAVDHQNNIYVSTGGKNVVRKITPEGIHSTIAGTGTAGFSGDGIAAALAQLKGPSGLLYTNSKLYFTDLGNYRIRSLTNLNFTPNSNRVLFVKKGSNGTGNSWNNAIGELADALEWAKDNASNNLWTADNPLQIWVAAGTYVPQYKLANIDLNNTPTTIRDNTFLIPNNVNLYGGFAGNETTKTDRIWNTNTTTLSGDLAENDLSNSFDNHTENVYHVVSAVDVNIKLDGFTIAGGSTTTNGAVNFNQKVIFRTAGAGIYTDGSTVNLYNIIFERNRASAAAVAYISSSTFSFKNSIARHNMATNIACFSITNSSNVNILNSAIYSNTATQQHAVLSNNLSQTSILNTVITKNTSGTTGPFQGTMLSNLPATQIYNSIIWGNTTGVGPDSATNFIALNNILSQQIADNWTLDPQFTDAANSDFTLKMTSPARNRGQNFLYTSGGGNLPIDKDLGNFARLIDTNIDLGPYELQTPLLPLSVVLSETHINCFGENTGAITATVTGGLSPYTYFWLDDLEAGAVRSNLTAGPYSLTVTDAVGNTVTVVSVLTQSDAALSTTGATSPNSCFGGTTGTAEVTALGGTAPYTYAWSGSASTTATASNLGIGTYVVTVTDAKGCSTTRSFNITQPTALAAETVQSNISCYSGSNGMASVMPSGGIPPYDYLWSNGATTQNITGLTAGDYQVQITDSFSCSITKNFTITEPDVLTITSTQTNMGCIGSAYGTADLHVVGGTAPYTYSWLPDVGNQYQATELVAGTYIATVTDANGCSVQHTLTILNDALTTIWDGTSWSNGTPNSLEYRAVFKGNFDSASNLVACSVSVEDAARVSIQSGHTLTVNHSVDIEIGAELIIEDQANLLQLNNDANSGIATVISKSAPMRWLDYTIWSSPVTGQKVFAFSPSTITSRIYTYKGALQTINQSPIDPTILTSSSVMEAGYGYFFRAPNSYSSLSVPTAYEGHFKGVLNNGSITVNTYTGDFTSIGNPYPSAVDLSTIVSDYDATLYFYTNSYPYVDGVYTGNNYASYNNTGATASGNGVVPTAIVQKGQGFIIETLANELEFTNSMRVSDAGVLMRENPIERHRYWIDLKDEQSQELYNQILIGYIERATAGFDSGKDAKLFGHNGSSLYSLIDQDESAYVIQGKGLPFVATDVVRLGFKAEKPSTFSITLNHFDGLFAANQAIILKDRSLNTEQDLRLGHYVFTSETGVFNNRFEITYQSQQLSTNQPKALRDWLAYKKAGVFEIQSTGFDIQTIEVYDMAGKRLFKSAKIDANSYVLPLINNQQILIIKLQTMGNQTFYKKVKN